MCCCIPLRKLSYFGAFLHILIGVFYLHCLGSIAYNLYLTQGAPRAQIRNKIGLMYMAYYAAFFPPGIFILWGVHFRIRMHLVVPGLAFLLVQCYGVTLMALLKYLPFMLPEALRKFNESSAKTHLELMGVRMYLTMVMYMIATLVYLFMLFFYCRELAPESEPPPSRYAQAYRTSSGGGGGGAIPHPHHAPPTLFPPHQQQQVQPNAAQQPQLLIHHHHQQQPHLPHPHHQQQPQIHHHHQSQPPPQQFTFPQGGNFYKQSQQPPPSLF